MSLWSRVPFLRITLAMAGGILVSRYCEGWGWIANGMLAGGLLAYVLVMSLVPLAQRHAWNPFLGVLGLGSVFWFGHLRFESSDVRHAPDHLMQLNVPVVSYEAIALEDSVRKSELCSVVVAVRRARVQGAWKQVQGKVRLLLSRDTAPQVRYGDVLLVLGFPSIVPSARNPYEFDYASFLGLSQVYHQHFLSDSELAVIGHHPPNPVQAWSFQVLRYCQSLLSQHIYGSAARAVVQALILGQKDALTPAVRSAYSGTGTMHVLAVSGLHVGILYWLVSLLLGLLRSFTYMRWLSPLLSIGALWFYAFVTGLSPSVLRATLMFTLLLLAPMLSRQSNIYNTLSASAFLLLFWNPRWLFFVSFQLSYLAVIGIVYLQPRIYGWLPIKHPILHKLWVWTSVSLAAQIATLPISIYYFHQFPTYFIVANWVVVPAALLILCLGVLILTTGFCPGCSSMIGWVLEKIVEGVNAFVAAIQALPYSIIDNIYLSVTAVLLLYGFLLLWLLFWHTRRLRYGVIASIVVVLLSLHGIHSYLVQQAQCQVIFYSISRHQVIAFTKGHQSALCVDDHFRDLPEKYTYHVQPSQTALGISPTTYYTFEDAVQAPNFPLQTCHGLRIAVWQGKRFVFVHKCSQPLPCLSSKLRADFLVVEDNTVATLLPLLDRFTFDTLVIGASNMPHVTEQLQAEAREYGLCSHFLRQQGALVVAW